MSSPPLRFNRRIVGFPVDDLLPDGRVDLVQFVGRHSPLQDRHFVARVAPDTTLYMLKKNVHDGRFGDSTDSILLYAYASIKDDLEHYMEETGATEGEVII